MTGKFCATSMEHADLSNCKALAERIDGSFYRSEKLCWLGSAAGPAIAVKVTVPVQVMQIAHTGQRSGYEQAIVAKVFGPQSVRHRLIVCTDTSAHRITSASIRNGWRAAAPGSQQTGKV